MPSSFIKFHGFGNDYIVIESRQLTAFPDAVRLGDFARRICNRHYGAGADGIAVIGPPEGEDADFQVRIFNPDGSAATLTNAFTYKSPGDPGCGASGGGRRRAAGH